MPWRAETDPSDETWADSLFRSEDGQRLLWLRAREGVEGEWLLGELQAAGAARTLVDERQVPVSDAVALAPEHAPRILRMTREALERYAESDPGSGLRLAEELIDAERELEREDVPGVEGGGHTKKEDPPPPTPYRELEP
jgi:hypothetical protein